MSSAGRKPVWVANVLIALTLGIAVGGVLPARQADEPGVEAPASMEQPWATPAPAIAIAPFDPTESAAGREYLPMNALESAESVARPDLPEAPVDAVAPPAGAPEPDSVGTADPPPPPPPPNPVRGLPATEAREIPLLVVRRGERVVFYETEAGRSLRPPGSIEGEWAVHGLCDELFRLDLAQPVDGPGDVRGIGRDRGASSWTVGIAVPAHACRMAAARWTAPRAPTAEDRSRLEPLGSGDLVSVIRPPGSGSVWLLFRGGDGTQEVVARGSQGGWERLWAYDASVVGSDLRLLGVYRGERWEGWVVEIDGAEPARAIRLTSADGTGWTADPPADMRR